MTKLFVSAALVALLTTSSGISRAQADCSSNTSARVSASVVVSPTAVSVVSPFVTLAVGSVAVVQQPVAVAVPSTSLLLLQPAVVEVPVVIQTQQVLIRRRVLLPLTRRRGSSQRLFRGLRR